MGECLIMRRAGETKKIPILNTNYPQDVTTTVIRGNTVSATFNVFIAEAGNPAVYSYQWYINGEPIEGATDYSYTKSDISTSGIYTIYCEVTNSAGTVLSREAILDVTEYYTPVLNSTYPANVTNASAGDSATFKVEIETEGNPVGYTYQWYVNGSAVSGATSSSYTISNIAFGNYTIYCEVTSSVGTVQSRTASLTVTSIIIAPNSTSYGSAAWTKKGSAATVTAGDSNTKLVVKASTQNVAYTVVPIDLTSVSTLTIKGTLTCSTKSTGVTTPYVGVFSKLPTYSSVGHVAGWSNTSSGIGDGDSVTINKTCDVSSLKNTYYIGVVSKHQSETDNLFTLTFTATSIKLT